MNKRTTLGFLLAATLAASPTLAATPLEKVIALLGQQGFEVVDMERTWLGRIKIEAENDQFRREIVFNRTSGEILRDIWSDRDVQDNKNTDTDRDDNG